MKQLWSECYSQKEILSILLSEGFEVIDRDVTLLRQSLRLRMREPNAERKPRADESVSRQPEPEDLARLKKRCKESDERLILGTRRVRTRTWNGIPADDPDLEPRFPSEKTISACKKDLGLDKDRKKYILIRDTFQRLCTEAGIIKKSDDPDAWENVKLTLVNTVPILDQAYSQPSRPKKGDPMWFALDIICSDVAKKIRVLNTRLDIKQVKQTLKLDPHKVTEFRRDFVKILRDANFKSRFDVLINVWDRLKRNLHSGSPHLQAVLPTEVWDHKDDVRVKAFEYLCRDVTKRYKDRRGKAAEDKEIVKAEPEPSPKELQGSPLTERKSMTPIAAELSAPQPYNGELANHRPVLRYTSDGLATVILEPETSANDKNLKKRKASDDSGAKRESKRIRRNSPNESRIYDHEASQNQDPFGRYGMHAMPSPRQNNHLSMPMANEHEDFTHRLGLAPAIPNAPNDDYSELFVNDHGDFVGQFGLPSPTAIDENDRLESGGLENHTGFAHQFGYGAPPDFSFAENSHLTMSAMENRGNCLSRTALETQFLFPIAKPPCPSMSPAEKHTDQLHQNIGGQERGFCSNRALFQSEFPRLETNPPYIPSSEDHCDFFLPFGAQPDFLPVGTDTSIPFLQDDHRSFLPQLGPADLMNNWEVDESFINNAAESFLGYEYPDPTNYEL